MTPSLRGAGSVTWQQATPMHGHPAQQAQTPTPILAALLGGHSPCPASALIPALGHMPPCLALLSLSAAAAEPALLCPR